MIKIDLVQNNMSKITKQIKFFYENIKMLKD